MLTRPGGMDHIAVPKGGGRDTQMVRARLSSYTTWPLSGALQYVIPRQPNSALEWNNYAGIYDQFKVNGMRVISAWPSDGTLGNSSYTAQFTSYPVVLLQSYDNDSQSGTGSLAVSWGFSTVAAERPIGLLSYSLPTLPEGASYGATFGTGYINSAEWTDCATPTALSGCVTMYLDRLAVAVTGAFSSTILIEWDVTFRGKRN
jgi:hypothetical protein